MKERRQYASRRCLVFDCAKSRFSWQCCQFCRKRNNCNSKCLNDIKKCNCLINLGGTPDIELCFRAKGGEINEYTRQVKR